MSDYGIGILSAGHYVPGNAISNEELCKWLTDTSPEWIIEKTGIKNRYYVSPAENASDMALIATRKVLEKNGLSSSDIGLIMVASFSQDYLFPPLSAKIHKELGGSRDCQIVDINTNCTGLVTALTIAAERMQADPNIKYSLVIGVELLSRFTNKNDQETVMFFSDGAACILLGRTEQGFGLMGSKFATDSSNYESVRLVGGGSSSLNEDAVEASRYGMIEQNGLATWKQAITNLPYVIKSLIAAKGVPIQDIDFVIFHQANKMLIEYILRKLHIATNKTFLNVDEIGNTGSASIGIALSEAMERKLIRPDSLLLLAGVGAGFNFGASLWRIK